MKWELVLFASVQVMKTMTGTPILESRKINLKFKMRTNVIMKKTMEFIPVQYLIL